MAAISGITALQAIEDVGNLRAGQSVLDIGGCNPLSRLRRALTPTGILVMVGGEDGGRWTGGVARGLRGMLMSPFLSQRLTTFISSEDRARSRTTIPIPHHLALPRPPRFHCT